MDTRGTPPRPRPVLSFRGVPEEVSAQHSKSGFSKEQIPPHGQRQHSRVDPRPSVPRAEAPPTQCELFQATHMRRTKMGREWVDQRSERTFVAEAERQPPTEAGEQVPPIDEEGLWLEVVGGPNKGRIYGTGRTHFVKSISSMVVASALGSASAGTDDLVRERVHALNQEIHQLQEALRVE